MFGLTETRSWLIRHWIHFIGTFGRSDHLSADICNVFPAPSSDRSKSFICRVSHVCRCMAMRHLVDPIELFPQAPPAVLVLDSQPLRLIYGLPGEGRGLICILPLLRHDGEEYKELSWDAARAGVKASNPDEHFPCHNASRCSSRLCWPRAGPPWSPGRVRLRAAPRGTPTPRMIHARPLLICTPQRSCTKSCESPCPSWTSNQALHRRSMF